MRTYGNMQAEMEYVGQGLVSIQVVDLRKEVVSGKQDPSYVGQRVGREGSDPRFTHSGRPLVEEMGKSLKLTLQGAKFDVASLGIEIEGHPPQPKELRPESSKASKKLRLQVKDWNMDSFGKGRKKLSFELELAVLDSKDRIVTESRVFGSETIQRCARVFFKHKLSELLNFAPLAEALRQD